MGGIDCHDGWLAPVRAIRLAPRNQTLAWNDSEVLSGDISGRQAHYDAPWGRVRSCDLEEVGNR